MYKPFIAFMAIVVSLSACEKTEHEGSLNEPLVLNQKQDCPPADDFIQSKDSAKKLILGKWEWTMTSYSGRGRGDIIITPLSTSTSMLFEFEEDKLRIYENDDLSEEVNYKIEFLGEGTNLEDEQLVITYINPRTAMHDGTSMLFLSSSSTCLKLVNSYNDAGGDLSFKRAGL